MKFFSGRSANMPAGISDIQAQNFDSCSLPSSSRYGYHSGKASQDEYQKFQNTVHFEDTVELDSPIFDNQLQNPHFVTELVDSQDFCVNDDVPMSEYDEVVPDSEDEETDRIRVISARNVLSRDKNDQKIKGTEIELKRKLAISFEQGEGIAAEFTVSSAEQSNTDFLQGKRAGNDSPQSLCSGRRSASLSYAGSDEPGEASQAYALGFVDNFLSFTDVSFSPGIKHRRADQDRSPTVPKTRGPQILVKKIKSTTPIDETRSFEWADCGLGGGESFFNKRTKASCNYGACRQIFVSKPKKVVQGGTKGDTCSDHKCGEKQECVDIQKDIASLISLDSRLDFCSDKAKNEDRAVEELNACEIFDIGFNTQIAAEAMEALSHFPICNNIGDVYQGPEYTFNDCTRGKSENKIHIEKSSEKSIFLDLGDSARKSKQKLHSFRKFGRKRSNSSQKRSDSWKTNSELTAKTKRNQSNLETRRQSCHMNFDGEKIRSSRRSSKSSQKTIAEGVSGSKSSIMFVIDSNIQAYKRKRIRSVDNHLNTTISKEVPKFHFDNTAEPANCQVNQRDQTDQKLGLIIGLRLEPWCYPRRKRTLRKLRSHSSKSLNSSLVVGDGNETPALPIKRLTRKGNDFMNVKEPQHSFENERTVERTVVNSSSSEFINVLSPTSMTSAASSNLSCKYRKRACNKNLPKFSLSKELVRLGFPESTPDIRWKDLRRRRAMTFLRVLFSQHLNDNIIKRQRKVVAQLGLSIASSSIDATHFVADKFARTMNMLEAIALGKPVVTHLWLESCGQTGSFIDEKNYILRDAKKEKEIGFSLPVSLARASKHPLLKGHRVLITRNVKPSQEMIISLVKAVQGQPMETSGNLETKDGIIPDDVLILSCEEDHGICLPFLKKGAAVYSSELLLNGIVIQKLEYGRHKLFKNYVNRRDGDQQSSCVTYRKAAED